MLNADIAASVVRRLRTRGLVETGVRIVRRLFPRRARCLPLCVGAVRARSGLEIGGPSALFGSRGILPLYGAVGSLDNCNFAPSTIWEGRVEEGRSYQYHPGRAPGTQFIREATRLSGIEDETYDFVLSCHTLEHIADPLGALCEWRRVLKPGGALIVVLPQREGTFDHRRPIAALQHLRDDFEQRTSEDDLTHLPEILALHDLALDPGAGGPEAFASRARENARFRSLHHHVFDGALLAAALDEVGYAAGTDETFEPYHIIAVATRPSAEVGHAAVSAARRGAK